MSAPILGPTFAGPFLGYPHFSRFLVFTNLPRRNTANWDAIVEVIVAIATRANAFDIQKVLRTAEGFLQHHVLWLAFSDAASATCVRGVFIDRTFGECKSVDCQFVSGNTYSSAASRSQDSWSLRTGFEQDQQVSRRSLSLLECLNPRKRRRRGRTHRSEVH
ncbi:unnamed protein product [Cyclocybe aegerita]|uniref:Uncharacterized protein n=1 Tax=Cyclocybe aegerita TaxID=1973307 RepID=A0A8S0XLT1_CYCAE|nr:unnamed protein product [Cyclocybe aegerita]